MARKSTRNAQGSGTIRQRPDGRWEARFTYTDELGQKKRASVYADTQKECRQKLTAALKSVDEGSYIITQRYTCLFYTADAADDLTLLVVVTRS